MSTILSPVRRVDIVGVPMDLGASRRGVDMGPSAVRYAKLHESLRKLGIETIVDRGNLAVPIRESADADDASAKFLTIINGVCNDLAVIVDDAVRAGGLPIVLGGDHSIAVGTLDGLTRARGEPPGLVWIDAHADINSPDSSPTGNVHGMPLYFALNKGFALADRTVQIGLRDVDASEKALLRQFGVQTFTMTDVDKRGMVHVMEESLA
ncbi:MAG TPA: arginase, partial [Candidatus Cybelea sp.]|nr:arginase [Candidatus Cybelea sp.]